MTLNKICIHQLLHSIHVKRHYFIIKMLCAISQQAPEEPVISAVSGCIFEKRLILKYVEELGKDPTNNEPLTKDQLIDVKHHTVKPTITSTIPQMLQQLRNEYDAVMLDSFELKKELMKTRQELSHALYQLDASFRVIARLKEDVEKLEKIQSSPQEH